MTLGIFNPQVYHSIPHPSLCSSTFRYVCSRNPKLRHFNNAQSCALHPVFTPLPCLYHSPFSLKFMFSFLLDYFMPLHNLTTSYLYNVLCTSPTNQSVSSFAFLHGLAHLHGSPLLCELVDLPHIMSLPFFFGGSLVGSSCVGYISHFTWLAHPLSQLILLSCLTLRCFAYPSARPPRWWASKLNIN